MKSQTVDTINKWLSDNCGNRANGLPYFRIVWSSDQFENRFGTFNEFYNNIFLRTVTKVKNTHKYTIFKDRWVLERYVPPEFCFDPSLPDTQKDGWYEAIYIFADKDRNYLEPDLEVVQALYYWMIHPMESGEIKANSDNILEKEDKRFNDSLNNIFDEESLLADKLKQGEAVFISDLSVKEK